MRRIFLLVVVGALATVMVLGAGMALAAPKPSNTPPGGGGGGGGGGQLPGNCTFDSLSKTTTCVTTTAGQGTEDVVSTATDVVVTKTNQDVVSMSTEFVERPTTGACQVGNSGRVGTAEGFNTDEVLVTTTETFLVTTTETFLVTTTKTFLVTTQTTTTEVFSGRGTTGMLLSSTPVTTEISRTLQNTVDQRDPQGVPVVERKLVGTREEEEVVNTEFTQTGKCKNIPGKQPQTRA